MVKKRVINKIPKYNLNFYFKWGLFGLKISLSVIYAILFFILIFLIIKAGFYEAIRIILRIPQLPDLLVIYAGSLLFIVVPFMIGVLVGRRITKKK